MCWLLSSAQPHSHPQWVTATVTVTVTAATLHPDAGLNQSAGAQGCWCGEHWEPPASLTSPPSILPPCPWALPSPAPCYGKGWSHCSVGLWALGGLHSHGGLGQLCHRAEPCGNNPNTFSASYTSSTHRSFSAPLGELLKALKALAQQQACLMLDSGVSSSCSAQTANTELCAAPASTSSAGKPCFQSNFFFPLQFISSRLGGKSFP